MPPGREVRGEGVLRSGGLVLVDKPAGPSSFAVVQRVGSELRAKAGHAGTLDPLATGLLLVLVGPATRLARYLVGLDKRYVTTIELGSRTSTGDAEGEPVEETVVPEPVSAVGDLIGEVDLRVPVASAVKIGGRRAYELHRQGVEVDMPVRRSTIHEAKLVEARGPTITVELCVSSGTYVRAIAEHLGGHCVALRRTGVGPFSVDQADCRRVHPAVDALPFLPRVELGVEEAVDVSHGRRVDGVRHDGLVRLVVDGELAAVARAEDGSARPETVLSPT